MYQGGYHRPLRVQGDQLRGAGSTAETKAPSSRGFLMVRTGRPYVLNRFRRVEFAWAVGAAGVAELTTPYTLRHSGLSWALAAGIPATVVARFGGTSLAMLERTYHHLLVSNADTARARMDEFLVASEAIDETKSS